MNTSTPGVETILAQAVEIAAPAQRQAFVERACAGDAALQSRVERLVANHFQAGNFLERPVVVCNPDGTDGWQTAADANGAGTSIGPYKLLELIGEGGMGLVYVAEQLHPIKRRLALKIIKPGMDSRQVVARFEAERQALAMMDHANIAKVHDGGTTEGGRPYFVMELVKGKPITDYCDKHRLTTRQRLELFLDVCHAVQHAHQKGIIHRDLKPSNVMVSLHDVRAVVKVIDFGVAKATGARLTDQSIYTGVAQMIGTPLYMSPEQAGLSDLDVDTRSDVYALGVLLYELLTGTTPFESETLKKVGYDEMRRIIREDEPPRPSTRLSTMQQARLSTIAERRRQEPRRLSYQVRGELDWIVMKALEKDRARRYESASAFAADVQRYLDDEPVAACPPSAGYRLRKLARRNRRFLVPACVIAMTLATATVVSTWQAVWAREAQRQAENDRKQAEADRDRAKSAERQAKTEQDRAKTAERRAATETAIARAVNDFLQEDLLGQADGAVPTLREDGEIPYPTVREALDRASALVGQRFRDQPLVEAAIRTTLGVTYHRLREFQTAMRHLKRAVDLRQAHLGADHPDTYDSIAKLAHAYQWATRFPEAIALRRELLERVKAQFGPDHPDTLRRMVKLAETLHFAGQLDESALLLEQVLEKQRARWGPIHPDTYGTMSRLAWTYGHNDQFDESRALYEKLLTLHKSEEDMRGFAEICIMAGKPERAEPLLRESLQLTRQEKQSLGQQNNLAVDLGLLALSQFLQGRYDEAESLLREALAIDQLDVRRHYQWVSVQGAVRLGRKKYAEAEPLLLEGYRGLKKDEALHPAVRRRLAQVGGWIVRLYEATNQPEKARLWREKLKPRHSDTAPIRFK